jgi:hypothetical protein
MIVPLSYFNVTSITALLLQSPCVKVKVADKNGPSALSRRHVANAVGGTRRSSFHNLPGQRRVSIYREAE